MALNSFVIHHFELFRGVFTLITRHLQIGVTSVSACANSHGADVICEELGQRKIAAANMMHRQKLILLVLCSKEQDEALWSVIEDWEAFYGL